MAQQKKARKTSKRLQRLAAPTTSKDYVVITDSSQEMEQTNYLVNYLLFYISLQNILFYH